MHSKKRILENNILIYISLYSLVYWRLLTYLQEKVKKPGGHFRQVVLVIVDGCRLIVNKGI